MNLREIYAACIYLSLSLFAFGLGGFTGLLILNAGFWVGAVDLGWVDDLFEKKPEPEVKPEGVQEFVLPDPLPDNVTPLPVRRARRD